MTPDFTSSYTRLVSPSSGVAAYVLYPRLIVTGRRRFPPSEHPGDRVSFARGDGLIPVRVRYDEARNTKPLVPPPSMSTRSSLQTSASDLPVLVHLWYKEPSEYLGGFCGPNQCLSAPWYRGYVLQTACLRHFTSPSILWSHRSVHDGTQPSLRGLSGRLGPAQTFFTE